MKEIEILNSEELEVHKKQDFLKYFENQYKDNFLPPEWSNEKRDRVLEATNSQNTKTTMLTSIPMVCRSEKCEFKNTCPLFKTHDEPTGYPCPIEAGIVRHLMTEWIETLDVDPQNITELTLIRDLVDQEVQLLRTQKLLAQESFIQENVVGVDSNGDPVMSKQLHLATSLQEKLHKRRASVLKQLVATREARVKAGAQVLDSAANLSTLMRNFKTVVDDQNSEMMRKLGIVEKDDYVEGLLVDNPEE